MVSLNVAYANGKSALFASQKNLAVVGNNVANADQAGYHRQSVSFGTNPPLEIISSGSMLGTGVTVNEVVRNFDAALEKNLNQALNNESYFNSYFSQIALVERAMAPDGTSPIQTSLLEFTAALQDMATDPTSIQAREMVLQRGRQLASSINQTRSELLRQQNAIADATGAGALDTRVDEINSYATQIADLNQHIAELENRKFPTQNANDLRDRRDQLVQELSKLGEVEYTEEADKTYTLTLGGEALVSGTTTSTVTVNMTGAGTTLTPELQVAGVAITQAPESGTTQGLIDAYQYVRDTITELDQFTADLTNTVNTSHANGFDLLGNAGANIFDNTTPGALNVSLTDPQELAASGTAGLTANGDNAQAIWDDIRNTTTARGTLFTHMDQMVDSAAIDVTIAEALAEGAGNAVTMYQEAIQSRSGVNIDQEMMDMLQIQRAYQTAAKFISTVDQMMQSALGMI